jgi:energy-coupling factor transporter transmembrane protein EcfT
MTSSRNSQVSAMTEAAASGFWRRPLPLEALVTVLVLAAAALAMSPNVADPDLWGHVQYGVDVLEEGTIPETTTYSFTANGYRWVNHENLAEIVMALIVITFGPLGLVLAKFLLGLAVIFIVFRTNMAVGCGLVVSSILTLLVAANLGYHWSIRPQLGTLFGFLLLICLFQFSFVGWRDRWHLPIPRKWFHRQETDMAVTEDGRADIRVRLGYDSRRLRWLWLLFPLMLVWGNTHGGMLAGIGTLGAYLGLRGVEALIRGYVAGQPNAGWGLVRRMSLMIAVAVLAIFINPYGPGLLTWLYYDLSNPRPEIADWSQVQLWTVVGAKFWVMAGLTVFSLAMTRRRLDATHFVLLGLFFWQSVTHFRHVPFFALAAGMWMGPHLKSALDRLSAATKPSEMSQRAMQLARWAMLLAILATGTVLANRLSDLRVERDKFPVDAIDFMRTRGIGGKMVVTFDWAQYAIQAMCTDKWACGVKSTIALDGRSRTCFSQELMDMHFDFLYGNAPHMPRFRSDNSPPIDPSRVLRYGKPELVLLRRYSERTEKHMNEYGHDWVLLYQDAVAQVWGHREIFDNPGSPRYLPPTERVVSNRAVTGSVRWPAIRRMGPDQQGWMKSKPARADNDGVAIDSGKKNKA